MKKFLESKWILISVFIVFLIINGFMFFNNYQNRFPCVDPGLVLNETKALSETDQNETTTGVDIVLHDETIGMRAGFGFFINIGIIIISIICGVIICLLKKPYGWKYTCLGILLILEIFWLRMFSNATLITAKPIIYIYPETETEVEIKLGKPENLTCTYPKYNESWRVKAQPNGELTDLNTGRKLYALYWEGKNTVVPDTSEGFVVKGEDSATFLEEKLEILGLNERETEEFIVYWLPKLEKNKYNFIRFQSTEEIEKNMPLSIVPKPDNVIRVVMEFKGMNRRIDIKEQELVTPSREGYTAVEWGGTEIR